MDLGFAALIGAMRTCNGFDQLPWDTIQEYEDMLEALKIDKEKFAEASNRDKAKELARQLALISLDEKLKMQLRLVDMLF